MSPGLVGGVSVSPVTGETVKDRSDDGAAGTRHALDRPAHERIVAPRDRRQPGAIEQLLAQSLALGIGMQQELALDMIAYANTQLFVAPPQLGGERALAFAGGGFAGQKSRTLPSTSACSATTTTGARSRAWASRDECIAAASILLVAGWVNITS